MVGPDQRAAYASRAPGHRAWLETLQARERRTVSIERAEDLVGQLSDAEAEIARLRTLLGRAVQRERWVSIGSIDSHAKLSSISRDLYDEVQEAIRG